MKFLTVVFLSLTVMAADPQLEPTKNPEPRKVFKSTEKHQFSGSKLKGQLKKPELSYIYQRKGLRAERIVKIPEDFNDEIASGATQF